MGRPRDVSDAEIVAAFQHTDDPFLTAREVGEIVGMGKRGMQDRLKDLSERDILDSKLAGQTRIWWLPDRVK